jgi:predicted O-methyltransferase YrrM
MHDLRASLRKFWSYTRFPRQYVRALLYFLWMMTFGVLERGSRARISEFSKIPPSPRLKWLRPGRKAAPVPEPQANVIPLISLPEVLGGGSEYLLFEPQAHRWNAPLLDVLILGRLARQWQPGMLFEFGTFDGRTSLNLIANAAASARLVTIDIQKHECRFEGTPYETRITRLIGDSRAYDLSPYLGTMDFVFVDAGHDYKVVRHDSEVALKMLRPRGGIVIWHDYGPHCRGVTQALNEFFLGDARFASARHVQETSLVTLAVGKR